jgi:hypothetical protein
MYVDTEILHVLRSADIAKVSGWKSPHFAISWRHKSFQMKVSTFYDQQTSQQVQGEIPHEFCNQLTSQKFPDEILHIFAISWHHKSFRTKFSTIFAAAIIKFMAENASTICSVYFLPLVTINGNFGKRKVSFFRHIFLKWIFFYFCGMVRAFEC